MSTEQKTKLEDKEIKWKIRPMRREDIDRCLDIWRQVKLTEAKQTVASALSADPGGFYVAEVGCKFEITINL